MNLKKIPMPKLDFVATFLNSRNAREKYMFIIFFGVFLFVVDYFLWLAPVFRVYGETALKIAPLKEELRSLQDDHKNKDEIRKKWETAKGDLEAKDKLFIAPDETPALLENLSKQAQRSGVRITSLEPFDAQKSAASKGTYFPLPIQVKATAGTHELGSFLSHLETGGTFFRVKDLKITSNPANERKHIVDLSMEAFKRDK